jgi:hypothetical protein
MPLDVLGCTRVTIVDEESVEAPAACPRVCGGCLPGPRGSGNLGTSIVTGIDDWNYSS